MAVRRTRKALAIPPDNPRARAAKWLADWWSSTGSRIWGDRDKWGREQFGAEKGWAGRQMTIGPILETLDIIASAVGRRPEDLIASKTEGERTATEAVVMDGERILVDAFRRLPQRDREKVILTVLTLLDQAGDPNEHAV